MGYLEFHKYWLLISLHKFDRHNMHTHRENSPITKTTPQRTLLIRGE